MLLWKPDSTHGVASNPRVDYMITGRRILSDLSRIVDWAFDGFEGVGSVLDFAAGYGRLTRFLIQEIPADRIWVSDIQDEAVSFQVEKFAVHGFTSADSPRDVSCDRLFDLSFVASLFSHLPHDTFTPWLRRLYEMLTNRGVLVFSVHDITLTDLRPDRRGISFIAQSESDRLDPDTYGTSYVSETYVTQAVQSATGQPGRLRRIPKGLCDFQDLYVVTGAGRGDLDALDTSRGLLGYLDSRLLTDDGLTFGGWVHDFSTPGVGSEVLALVNGVVIDRCQATGERPDVATQFAGQGVLNCGWAVSLPVTKLETTDVIAVKAVSGSGRDLVLMFDTVEALLRRDEY
jgi:hypothetical protein